MARRIRAQTRLALVLFSYLNPLLRPGLAKSAAQAREAGFDGVLLTDLPADEAREYVAPFRRESLDTIFLVSPTSPGRRMASAARLSSGFLYVVSRPGTTGARAGLPADLSATIRRARRAAGTLPLAVGFGIATPKAAATAARLADGVVVGSALVEAAERAGSGRVEAVERLASRLARACRRGRA
jgi:tryptophan synthase alpha chain